MGDADNYIAIMDGYNKDIFRNALKISFRNPDFAFFMLKMLIWQKSALKKRRYWENRGVHVPPYIIASITNRCNLKCKGCYARAQKRALEVEMGIERWKTIFEEARELGISAMLLAGGEPFVRKELLDLTGNFKEIVFPVFTNGTMLDDGLISFLKHHKNIVPVISMEGFQKDTDDRRGKGIYENAQNVISKIKDAGIFMGVSLTVTRHNFNTVTDKGFIQKLISSGCRMFFFVEYVPVEDGTGNLVLDQSQRKELNSMVSSYKNELPGIFTAFPGDEEKFGGCVAAGRGFIHISPSGKIEPCPFAPYSDANLNSMSLKDALNSELMRKIRDEHDKLTETKGGCALWNNREWVQSLIADSGEAAEEKA